MARTKNTSMFNRSKLLYGSPPRDDNWQNVEQQQEEDDDLADELPPSEFTLPPLPHQPATAAAQQPPTQQHAEAEGANTNCPDCGKYFGTVRGMRIHLAKHNQQTRKSPRKLAGTSTRPKLMERKSGPAPIGKAARKKSNTRRAGTGYACAVCGKLLAYKHTWKKHEERCQQLMSGQTNNTVASPNNARAPTAAPNAPTGQILQPNPIGTGTVRPPTVSPLAALINGGMDLDQQPCSSAQSRQQPANWPRNPQIQQQHPASSSTPTIMDENDAADDEIEFMDVKPPVIGLQQELQQQRQWEGLSRLALATGREFQMTVDRRGKLVVTIAGSTELAAPAAPQNEQAAAAEPQDLDAGIIRRSGVKTEQQN